jgi:hypothetical protein
MLTDSELLTNVGRDGLGCNIIFNSESSIDPIDADLGVNRLSGRVKYLEENIFPFSFSVFFSCDLVKVKISKTAALLSSCVQNKQLKDKFSLFVS